MGRRPCCSRVGLKKSTWSRQEDTILINYINTHGAGHWRDIPEKAGLKRCGKSCRFRWLNYLRPDIKRGGISSDEEELIMRLHRLLGNRWSLIAGRLPGRTDNEIKNHWNTMLRKRVENNDKVEKKNKAVRPKAVKCIRFINIPHQQDHHSHAHNNIFINDQHPIHHDQNLMDEEYSVDLLMGLEQDGPSSNVVNLQNSLNPWNYHNFTDHVLKSSGDSNYLYGEFNGFNNNPIDGNYFGEVNGHNLTDLQSMEGTDFSALASFLNLGDDDWVLPP